jgi:hypothetical protein
MHRSGAIPPGTVLAALGLSLVIGLAHTAPAEGARTVAAAERTAMAKAAAASPGGVNSRMRVDRRGRVTMRPLAGVERTAVLAVRSSVDPRWALLVATPGNRPDLRTTFLMRRGSGQWRVHWSARRGSEADAVCRVRAPGSAVVFDLGLSSDTWSARCRYPRNRRTLTRPMTAAEVASVRAMVEWTWESGQYEPGPVQPQVRDVFASDCRWESSADGSSPTGTVARINPRWGMLSIQCAIGGSDGGALIGDTVMLVGRAAPRGAFTRVLAHTHPAWSVRGGLCTRDRRWPVPDRARVALGFCTPFPSAIRRALI